MVRLKHRYLLVNILYPVAEQSTASTPIPDLVSYNQATTDALTRAVLTKAIKDGVLELFGEYGAGAIAKSLNIKYLSPATSTFIVRTSRAHYNLTWAALAFLDSIPVKNGKPCIFRVVRVSGTIRKVEEEAIRRAREMILRARSALAEQGDATLNKILGNPEAQTKPLRNLDIMDVDHSGSDEDPNDDSEGKG